MTWENCFHNTKHQTHTWENPDGTINGYLALRTRHWCCNKTDYDPPWPTPAGTGRQCHTCGRNDRIWEIYVTSNDDTYTIDDFRILAEHEHEDVCVRAENVDRSTVQAEFDTATQNPNHLPYHRPDNGGVWRNYGAVQGEWPNSVHPEDPFCFEHDLTEMHRWHR